MEPMDLTLRLQRHSGLTQNERYLRDYILRYPGQVARMNARELARASFTSPSAVIRFCQKFGCRGWKDFKAELFRAAAPARGEALPDADFPFTADTPPAQVIDAVLRVEQESLARVRQALRAAKAHGAPVVAVTARPGSASGMQADCLLPLPPMESNDAKISTFASALAEKAVLDVLLARLFQQDYARNVSFVRADAERLVEVRLL